MTDYPFKDWSDFTDVATFCAKRLMEKTHLFTKKGLFERCAYASRDNARTPVQWSAEENAGFSTGTPWFHVNPNYKEINVAAAEADPDSILNYYRAILKLRKEYKDTAIYGEYKEHLKRDKRVMVYDKIAEDGSKLTVVINLSDKPVSARRAKKFVAADAKRLIGNYKGSMADMLKPYEAHVFYTAKK